MTYDFAVIGLGKIGGAMLELLGQAGHRPMWAVSSRPKALNVPVHDDIPEGLSGARVVFIAVPDGVIEETAARIAEKWRGGCKGLVFYHFSGLHTSHLLHPLARLGAETGSLHPLQSILEADRAKQSVQEAFFVFEGSPAAREVAQEIVSTLSSKLISISGQDKVIYHAAAVIASNYLVAVASEASDLMETVGLGMDHLMPLIRGTLGNIGAFGRSALTGPVQRGDWGTVDAHIRVLQERFPDILPSYLALGRYTARLASRKWPGTLKPHEKLMDRGSLKAGIEVMKARGMKVVFTNGCFDILHEGHVSYLQEAKGLGDVLVVGLNSDASVRRLKGDERPVSHELSRACVLSGLECVDLLCIFEEDTPYELISELCPDVLVKGGDWRPETIVGSDIVRSYGGEVLSLAFRPGHSTTGIIEKIKSL